MRTSYSAINTYLACPQKYKFQEIDRIKVPKSFEAVFGTLIHATLAFMFRRSPLFPTLDEVLEHFRAHWPSKETLSQESKRDPLKKPLSDEEEQIYMEEGIKMLKKFYEKNLPWNYDIVDLESRFDAAITDPKTGEAHILTGIIDRIDRRTEGGYGIIRSQKTRKE